MRATPEKGPPIDINAGRKHPAEDPRLALPGQPAAEQPENGFLAREDTNPNETCGEVPSPARTAGLTEKQLEALAGFDEGLNVTEVADRTGVHRSTIHRWLQDPHFLEARNRLMEEKFDQLRARSLAMGDTALDALDQLLKNPLDDRHRLSAVKIACRIAGLDRPPKS